MAKIHSTHHPGWPRGTALRWPVRPLIWLWRGAQVLVVALALYCAAAIVLGLIPRNTDYAPPAHGITIFLTSNGVHADIAVPARHDGIDWRGQYPAGRFPQVSERMDYLSFGWGDRGFYLNTERWADLTAGTAAVALLGIGSSAMHVEYMERPRVDDTTVALVISEAQYAVLADYIRRSAMRTPAGEAVPIAGRHYGSTDAFFEANGTYNLFRTSNEWARAGLQEAGVRVPVWAPFDTFLFFQLR